jgi:hypothetical protein
VIYAPHTLHEWNLKGSLTWRARWRRETLLGGLAQLVIDDACTVVGLSTFQAIHKKIDALPLWEELEKILEEIRQRPGLVVTMTNSERVSALGL